MKLNKSVTYYRDLPPRERAALKAFIDFRIEAEREERAEIEAQQGGMTS